MLSALAGGGLTAAGFAGQVAPDASAATGTGTPADPTTTSETGTPPAPSTPEPTSTATTPTPTTPTPTATTPSSTETTSVPVPSPPHKTPAATEGPTVVLQRKQKASRSERPNPNKTTTGVNNAQGKDKKATGPNGVAPSPQSVAAQAGALAAMLASSEASAQALTFYRVPLFLLPIYKAAAVQYGVPWQILAAINEIETDYGADQSVSSAGAVGWMQFMPSTWLQYGVDALSAGYADPYNPVDAIFAAARYLRAAGAAKDLRGAILAYNHSEEYADSVLLRAKLISTYPKGVIATLTGLVDGRLPVTGKHIAWSQVKVAAPPPVSNATASATAVPSQPAGAPAGTPGSTPALSPAAAAAAAAKHAAARPLQFVELLSPANASVVAVQDGRIVRLGDSHKLGKYVVLRDVYGDLFTYAGLGSIAPSYAPPKAPRAPVKSPVVEAASTHDPAPSQPASAGTQAPVTLQVKKPTRPHAAAHGHVSLETGSEEAVPPGMGKVRLFAHPGNPDARAAAAVRASRRVHNAGGRLALRRGSVVASGTVLGRVKVPPGATAGHLRFAIRPAGDAESINPSPILANWAQLQTALHPQGAKAANPLLGATASDVLLLSSDRLERAVLSDPGIKVDTCGRREIAAGRVDRRVLALLAFLSRSGLKPTVTGVSCSQGLSKGSAETLDISSINGTAIAGHQGSGSITDLTIRTLLTLPAEFVPHAIVSLMRYPGSPNTHSSAGFWNRIHLAFHAPVPSAALNSKSSTTAAHSAHSGATAPAPVIVTSVLSPAQWGQLMERVATIPAPKVATKPSDAAIPDAGPKQPTQPTR